MTYSSLPVDSAITDGQKSLLVFVDDPRTKRSIDKALHREYLLEYSDGDAQPLELMENGQFACVIIDITESSEEALVLLQKIRRYSNDVPVIMMCNAEDISTAVDAVRYGASDFVIKEIELGNISERINGLLLKTSSVSNIRSVSPSSNRIQDSSPDRIVIGKSRQMLEIISIARRAARLPVPVLLLGESGTGKELFARWIHRMSGRAEGPFVAVNLAAIPQDLIESTLFGHVKGAFTGAVGQRIGKFLAAQNGSLLLDEVAELNFELQPKLLRVLQEGEFEPVGSERMCQNGARVIAATNQDLVARVQEGQFRRDLFYRLNVVTITLPPLRERKEDIPALAELFLARYNHLYKRSIHTLSRTALEALIDHGWPGNIRELENMIQRAVIVADDDVLTEADFSFVGRETEDNLAKRIAGRLGTMDDLEHAYIELILKRTKGHPGQAARILNIDRKTLKDKINKYELDNLLSNDSYDDDVIDEIYPNSRTFRIVR